MRRGRRAVREREMMGMRRASEMVAVRCRLRWRAERHMKTTGREGVALRNVDHQPITPRNIDDGAAASAAKGRTVALVVVLAHETGRQRDRVIVVAVIHSVCRKKFWSHLGETTQANVGAGSGLKISKDIRKLHGRANEIMAENFRGLHPLGPVRTALPGAQRGSACDVCRDVLQIEERRLGKEKRGQAGARCSIHELCLDDGVEGDLHFEAVPRRVNEPNKTAPRLADVRDKVVLTDLRSNPSPSADGEVRTGDNGDSCTLSRRLSVHPPLLRWRMIGTHARFHGSDGASLHRNLGADLAASRAAWNPFSPFPSR